MTVEKLIVILIVLVWADDTLPKNHQKLLSNEYILYRCTATAELIRKHRNEQISTINSGKAEDFLRSDIQRRSPDSLTMPLNLPSEAENFKQTSSSYRRTTHMRRRGNVHGRRITEKNLADTPLKTVNIEAPQDRPSAFRKKIPLPELMRNVSNRKIDSSPHVIMIKSIV